MKILISWIGWVDFDRNTNRLSKTSPNIDMHKAPELKGKFDKHILLSTENENNSDKTEHRKAMMLYSYLQKEYKNRCKFEIKFLNINDPFNFDIIYHKISALLDEVKEHELFINFSIGTTVMRIIWEILYQQKPYRIKLIFGREPGKTDKNKPQFQELLINTLYPGVQKPTFKAITDKFEPIITPVLENIYARAAKAAKYDIAITIMGATGSGKELMAKFIHNNSKRAGKEFIAVNCASLSDELLESRLFGHKKGSFTGATSDQTGFFKKADGGTIFLDEIGDISGKMQQSLLRVLQEGTIIPVGETKGKKVDVRVICATNKDLKKEVEKGNFRADLYYRLTEAIITLPSLNSFPDKEKQQIIDHFIRELQYKFDKKLFFGSKVKNLLYTYSYPGNIRELEANIKNIYIFNDNKVDYKETKLLLHENKIEDEPELLNEVVKRHCYKIYLQYGSNYSKASKVLGISINTLKKHIQEIK
jgi:transcriptional regulator of acetoin/glycerol metabolism